MSWDDFLNPHMQPEHECEECGEPIEWEGFCSHWCYQSRDI
jgi:predicted nucleic acid-binding Zn ribbon protein